MKIFVNLWREKNGEQDVPIGRITMHRDPLTLVRINGDAFEENATDLSLGVVAAGREEQFTVSVDQHARENAIEASDETGQNHPFHRGAFEERLDDLCKVLPGELENG